MCSKNCSQQCPKIVVSRRSCPLQCDECETEVQECLCGSGPTKKLDSNVTVDIGCDVSIFWTPLGLVRFTNESDEKTQTIFELTAADDQVFISGKLVLEPKSSQQQFLRFEIGNQDIKSIRIIQNCQFTCRECLSEQTIILYTAATPFDGDKSFDLGCSLPVTVSTGEGRPQLTYVNDSQCTLYNILKEVFIDETTQISRIGIPPQSTVSLAYATQPVELSSLLVTSNNLGGVTEVFGTVTPHPLLSPVAMVES